MSIQRYVADEVYPQNGPVSPDDYVRYSDHEEVVAANAQEAFSLLAIILHAVGGSVTLQPVDFLASVNAVITRFDGFDGSMTLTLSKEEA